MNDTRNKSYLFGALCIALVVFAVGMRLNELDLPRAFDLDEGVYWQSLRAMHVGARLYQQIYYSQPPLFLASTYPAYASFGQSIFSARLAMLFDSLVGLAGGYLVGRVVSGPQGGAIVLCLLVVSAPFLAMSQTLQAEAPAIGFGLLGVGLAFVAARSRLRGRSCSYAAFSGLALGVAICSKLLAASSVAAALVVFATCAFGRDDTRYSARNAALLVAAFSAGFTAVLLAVGIYFADSMHALLTQVVAYHVTASKVFRQADSAQAWRIGKAFVTPLGVAAMIGTVSALWRRERAVVSLALWAIFTVLMLDELVPLYDHHLVALVAPLASFGALIVYQATPSGSARDKASVARYLAIAGYVAVVVALLDGIHGQLLFHQEILYREVYGTTAASDAAAVRSVSRLTSPNALVVTDAQFLTALADRSTPPWLVDTTLVRIYSGQLTEAQLVQQSSRSDVDSVLFFGGRLAREHAYHEWATHRFKRYERLGGTNELRTR